MFTVLTLTVLLWLPGTLLAQGKAEVNEALQDMLLTSDQETKLADIRQEYKPKVQAAAKTLRGLVKEEVEKVRGVLTAVQKTTVAEIKEENKDRRAHSLAERMAHFKELDLTPAEMKKFKEIRKEFRPKFAQALEGLKGILSADQKATREDGLKAGKKRSEIVASLKLSDDQKEKFEAAGKVLANLVREKLEKIHGVLSAEQKIKIAGFKDEDREHVRDRMAHMIANLKSLDLTDQQKSEIMAIRKECQPKIHEAGNALRAMVREEVQAIIGVLKG
jgi:flagellar motor protein MotB